MMPDSPDASPSQIEDLQRAMAALESQRAVLGNPVVDEALSALRARLAALHAPAPEQRKLVTVLFADLVGFTALSETLDPEDVRDLQQDYFTRWRRAIEQHGGVVEKFIGDAVMAVFGVPAAGEDDPERAVQSALALHSALDELNAARGLSLQMRAGVHTGPVLVSGSGADLVATGDTVNVAARLQAHAPPGGSLISHDTYQHVSGLFDLEAQPPLALKGKAEPLQAYLVAAARPGAFRAMQRGVEGVETRMVGREAELLMLQKAYHDALDDRRARLALVVAEPGLGKSRLAYEFGLWLVDRGEPVVSLRARATPQSSAAPAALLRNLFGEHFAIHDTDSAAEVIEKFRQGSAGSLSPAEADILGQFCGYDFSASEAVRRLLGQDALAHLGLTYFAQYIERLGQARPVVMVLEDLHWADDRSLDALLGLAAPQPLAIPLFILGLARPSFFERRPHWGEGLEPVTRLDLKPLSRRESRELVAEILQHVPALPDSLRDLIAGASEGNPFFAEELVKMLVDDGVLLAEGGQWLVVADRVAGVRVPGTLAGVLQARLDSLPPEERETLQRAAVVGREFWDEAVARLAEPGGPGDAARPPLSPILATLRGRELVYRHERSAFAGAAEFVFKHALLRDVAYETVLRRLRRTYHRQVAEWMENRAGERLDEHAGLIAYHYQQAEAGPQALRYLTLAAGTALARYANSEAAAYFQQALALEPDVAARASLLDGLGRALARRADYSAAVDVWHKAIALYQALGDTNRAARLYARMGRALWYAHDTAGSLSATRSGLEALRGAPVSPGLAALYHETARSAFFSGEIDEAYAQCQEALDMAEEIRAVDVQADALATLGLCPQLNLSDRLSALRKSIELAETTGLVLIAQRAYNNYGTQLSMHGVDQAAAMAAFRRAVQLVRQRGALQETAFQIRNLFYACSLAGDLQCAGESVDALERIALTNPASDRLKYIYLRAKGSYLSTQGHDEQAIGPLQACADYYDTLDDPQTQSLVYLDLGFAYRAINAYEDAESALTRAISLDDRRKGGFGGILPRVWLADILARRERWAEAESTLAAARTAAGPNPSPGVTNALQSGQAWLAMARSDWDTAINLLQDVIERERQASRLWFSATTALDLAAAYQGRAAPGDLERARSLLQDTLVQFQAMGATGYVDRTEVRLRALNQVDGQP